MLKVSIIVPIYNVEKYLSQCLDSIIGQTYSNIEIILIDDGSTDNSPQICDEYAKQDGRIRVIHKENSGASSARNLGLKTAKGEYLAFMDPDDWLDLNTIEFCIKRIQENDLDIIRFNYVREYADKSLPKANTFLQEKVYNMADCKTILRQTVGLVEKELQNPENLNFLSSVCFGIYRKEIIDVNGLEFYDIRKIGAFSDGLFNINYLLHVKKFQFINEYFYHYRKTNSASATANYRKDFLAKQLLLFSEIKNILERNNLEKEFYDAYYNRIAVGVMEQCRNVYKKQGKFTEKKKEVAQVFKQDLYREAIKRLKLRWFPFKWKVYFGFIKSRWIFGVCMMTSILRKIKK